MLAFSAGFLYSDYEETLQMKWEASQLKNLSKKKICVGVCLLVMFILWTVLVCLVDVQPIGPQDSAVGFAALNGAFHRLTGVHMALYDLTDWLSVLPLGIVVGFAALGLVQLIGRKSLQKVDFSIFVLGGFYVVVMAAFVLFEVLEINYRPVLIEGVLEASYPSSTTMLVMCVMPTTMLQLKDRLENSALKRILLAAIALFTAFMVIGRLISGVHWLTDIIGGALLSAGLVVLYDAVCGMKSR